MKLTHQKENTHTHTHRARNHRAYQPVVIEQTRIVQNSRQRGNELERRGNIEQRGEKEGGSGSRELKLRGPGWWEDGGCGGEAGLPVPSAAADFWEGRKSTAGLGLSRGAGGLLETSLGRRGGPGMFPNPYGMVETVPSTTLGPEYKLGRALALAAVASASWLQTVLFADSHCSGRRGKKRL